MVQNSVSTWLRFALQQMAAESYLDRTADLTGILIDGNNNRRVIPVDQFTGKIRMTALQAQQFTQRYQIIDHHADDATGFSATLMKDRDTGEYTLSFRSVEYALQAKGGDYERDGGPGASGEIGRTGFAFAQLVSMERYYRELKANPTKLPVGAVLNVTGYSLGGHLATVFTELHAQDTNINFGQTVTFNAAGRGFIVAHDPLLQQQPAQEQIRAMLADVETRILAFDPTGTLFRSGASGSVYPDQRYSDAVAATRQLFDTTGTSNGLAFPIGGGLLGGLALREGAFEKITQLYGQALTGSDAQLVANSGVHGPVQSVLIEGQPQFEGKNEQERYEFGNSHSLTLVVDSLALMALFQEVDPNLSQTSVESIFKVASQARSDVLTTTGDLHTAEGDTLERALDALRAVFLGVQSDRTTFDDDTGGFGDLTARTEYYQHMQDVRSAVAGQTYSVVPLVGSAANWVQVAMQQDSNGLAYRFALRALNPFVVLGHDASQTQALYTPHNTLSQLDLVNLSTGIGALTTEYLNDRAGFLGTALRYGEANGTPLTGFSVTTRYQDVANEVVIDPVLPDLQRYVTFNDDSGGTITGGERADRLYGGGGNDTLYGGGNPDYLEGQHGNDLLDGGTGVDRMAGGADDDTYIIDNVSDQVIEGANNGIDTVRSSVNYTLSANVENLTLTGTADLSGTGNSLDNTIIGNTGNNTLEGKGGADLLEGGLGFDTYLYHTGDGVDRIEDSDGAGQILFDGRVLQEGVRRQGDAASTYRSFDGRDTYVLNGGDLIVDGVLTVNEHFQSGQFGIRLIEETSYANGLPEVASTFGDNADTFVSGGAGINLVLHMAGGNDYVLAGRNNDQIFGETGDDTLFGNSGNDRLFGGIGEDALVGDNDDTSIVDGNDLLEGGDGNDYLIGGWGNDLLYGGLGNDRLYGDTTGKEPGSYSADDYLDGGEGDDELHGLNGNDVLYGGAGNDFLSGEEGDDSESGGDGDDVILAYTGNDTLSGDTGVDKLYGDIGDDLLDGGSENDELYGGDGNDTLFGGSGDDLMLGDYLNSPTQASVIGGDDFLDGEDGNDHLEGGLGNDTLFGGADNDLLFGEDGNDSLFGDEGNDELQGGNGHDLLSGDTGNDILFGEVGNDTLYGDDGADYLEGGKGDDVLDGGAGNDTYYFAQGDGHDLIADTFSIGAGNAILFGPGISLTNLTLIQDQAQSALTIQVGGGADSIRLQGFDLNHVSGTSVVQTLAFADGNQVQLPDLLPLPSGFIEGSDNGDFLRTGEGDDLLNGGDGDDVLVAGGGEDTLIGGTGDDVLLGGAGDDIYVFGQGDGHDRIQDVAATGEGNTLNVGVALDAVTLDVGDGLVLRVGASGDTVTLADFNVNDPYGEHTVETFQFAGGTSLNYQQLIDRGFYFVGTAGNDIFTGTGARDRFSGRAGDDTYRVTNVTDQVIELAGEGTDTIETTISYTLPDHVENLRGVVSDVIGDPGPASLIGNALDNEISGPRGFSSDNVLEGRDGNDRLFGYEGNDRLDGGAGNDYLEGGQGNDTYVFGLGSGQDTAFEQPFVGDIDTIELIAGINPDDVTLKARRVDALLDLVLGINGRGEELILRSALDFDALPFEEIVFSDGTIWDQSTIFSHIEGVALTASMNGSSLFGTRFADRLNGLEGDDYLDGFGGPDIMSGGAGNDQYQVEDAGDTVIEMAGEGHDGVMSSIDYTLPANVENLTLLDTFDRPSPIIGIGNNLDNVLFGNGISNILRGGAGNDVVDGELGNDDLSGGSGNDTYYYDNAQDGIDTIHDVALPVEGNRIQFGPTIAPHDLNFTQDGTSLFISVGTAGHGLFLLDFDPANVADSTVVDSLAFSGAIDDASRGYEVNLINFLHPLSGTNGDETITGTSAAEVMNAGEGDDVLIGGAGNDVLIGGAGRDIYRFNAGDGFDLIDDVAQNGEENVVLFGAGVTPDMLQLRYDGTYDQGGLTVQVGTAGDGLHFLGIDPDDPMTSVPIKLFEFADCTAIPFAQLWTLGSKVQGTPDNDALYGTFADDQLFGLSGSDFLLGGDGDDILTGGPGNDELWGGPGADTYVFGLGDGVDRIRDDVEFIPGDYDLGIEDRWITNRILFQPGITLADLTLLTREDHFTIEKLLVGTNGDAIELPNFIDFSPGLTKVAFADGLNVDLYDLFAAGQIPEDQIIFGGPDPSTLIGGNGNDTLTAGAGDTSMVGGPGNDTLRGGAGNNKFYGGPGFDLLVGGSGNNAFVFSIGSGIDTIRLPTNLPSGNSAEAMPFTIPIWA